MSAVYIPNHILSESHRALALSDALDTVAWSALYNRASRLASRATGRERCRWAGLASGYARKARRAAKLHNDAMALSRAVGG